MSHLTFSYVNGISFMFGHFVKKKIDKKKERTETKEREIRKYKKIMMKS